MTAGKLQFFMISSAVLVATGLYLAPSQVKPGQKALEALSQPKQGTELDMFKLVKDAESSLNDDAKGRLGAWQMTLQKDPNNLGAYDSIAAIWDQAGVPAASGWTFNLRAEKEPTEKNHLNAAYRYFDAFKMAENESLRKFLVNKAITEYSAVLAINPENLDARTDLGVCYAEGTNDPMKGIMILREVIAKNPRHETALLNLGLLAIRSGQMDKALQRFDQVLDINPARTEALLYKGQVYLQQGDTTNALSQFEHYVQTEKDYRMVQEVNALILTLKKKIRPA